MGKITNYNQIAYKQQSIKYIEVSENKHSKYKHKQTICGSSNQRHIEHNFFKNWKGKCSI